MFELSTSTFNLGKDVLEKFAYQPPRSLLGYGLSLEEKHSMDAAVSHPTAHPTHHIAPWHSHIFQGHTCTNRYVSDINDQAFLRPITAALTTWNCTL
jgi:hypothetical protein